MTKPIRSGARPASKKKQPDGLTPLPKELQERTANQLDLRSVGKLRCASKIFRDLTPTDTTQVPSEVYSPITIRGKADTGIFVAGFRNGKWKKLFYLNEVGKGSVRAQKRLGANHGGLFCSLKYDSKNGPKVVVTNPIIPGEILELPPMLNPRMPVLLHIRTEKDRNGVSFKVIVAGCASEQENLSRKTEIYDSKTHTWSSAGDISGGQFSLTTYQEGAFLNGRLHCLIAISRRADRPDISHGVGYLDIEKRRWSSSVSPCPGVRPYFELMSRHLFVHDNSLCQFEIAKYKATGVSYCYVYKFTEYAPNRFDWTKLTEDIKINAGPFELTPELSCVSQGEEGVAMFAHAPVRGFRLDLENNLRTNFKFYKTLFKEPAQRTLNDLINPVELNLAARFLKRCA